MNHDQLFKSVLRHFFREFLELFFPDIAPRLDLDAAEFVEAEFFRRLQDDVSRQPDVIARVRTREGDPAIVFVHVEEEAGTDIGLGRRMFEYFMLLWLHFEVPVFPIVLYTRGGGRQGTGPVAHTEKRFGEEVVRFQYASVALPQIVGREYVEKGPLGTALSSLMRWDPDSDEPTLRLRLLRRLARSGLDEASLFLLVDLVETYLPVLEGKREQYQRLVSRKEYREARDVELTWADGLRKEGREEGLVEGKRETLKRQLATRFGPLPADVVARIDAVTSAEELEGYLERVLTASSLREMGLSG